MVLHFGLGAQLLMSGKRSYGEVVAPRDLPREPASFQLVVWGSSDFPALFACGACRSAVQGGTGTCGRKCHPSGVPRRFPLFWDEIGYTGRALLERRKLPRLLSG